MDSMDIITLGKDLIQFALIPFCVWIVREILLCKKEIVDIQNISHRAHQRIDDLPSRKELYEVMLRIENLVGDVKGLRHELKGVHDCIKRLTQILEKQENHILSLRHKA
ncbi:MAG: hypothetical protein ACRCV3_01115 [Desulfovibrionaceae bacterium]